jgi:hypothetical protein
MKFKLTELDNGWLLDGERRWGEDADNEQLHKAFPTLEAALKELERMVKRERKMRAR